MPSKRKNDMFDVITPQNETANDLLNMVTENLLRNVEIIDIPLNNQTNNNLQPLNASNYSKVVNTMHSIMSNLRSVQLLKELFVELDIALGNAVLNANNLDDVKTSLELFLIELKKNLNQMSTESSKIIAEGVDKMMKRYMFIFKDLFHQASRPMY